MPKPWILGVGMADGGLKKSLKKKKKDKTTFRPFLIVSQEMH